MNTQEFLAKENVEFALSENAGTKKYTTDDLDALFDGIDHIYASRGKNVQYFDLRAGMPSVEEMKGFILGPTGNFRAPAVRNGRTLVVGFNAENLQKLF